MEQVVEPDATRAQAPVYPKMGLGAEWEVNRRRQIAPEAMQPFFFVALLIEQSHAPQTAPIRSSWRD